MSYERFVVVGDSCAEGLDDPYPGGGQYRGWADLVADGLAEHNRAVRYANLAVRGRRLDQISTEQLPDAERLRPDLAALFGGGNDVLTPGWNATTVAARVDTAVRRLADSAPTVVTFTLSDISDRMPFGRRLRPRIEALNEAIRAAAGTYGAILVDLWPDQAARDLRYFGRDRLHLGEHGHRRVAAHVLDRLGLPYARPWLDPLAGAPARPGPRAQADWLLREVLPAARTRLRNRIIGRSPGDGFLPKRPELLPVTTR
ncbi:SGNH/GDSL hydrolase family protein [Amycolatopsis cihanbeyliensis]|uniref:Lysophospholipase L1-like esterase n=1 Tax=Amycolatopsis cihanbeyliensis TaxID=1128664 RepID=A0A542DQV6_AMYCI|nr:SGNH/GDSL hydrolase family protein [Amycolatopsis cihanbeyliensis]TQJ05374.1 lysophospholipase L1-like esterase [Amycolatopsis cihanbeyliensis]